MVQICILTLIGLPAAGKSSFCQWIIDQHFPHFEVIHICYDDFIPVGKNGEDVPDNEFNYKLHRLKVSEKVQTIVHKMKCVESSTPMCDSPLSRSISTCLKLIICDDNNYYRSMRYQMYKFCRSQRIAYAQVFFSCVLSVALARNRCRSGTALLADDILNRMYSRLEPPKPNEFSWETNTLMLDALEPLHALVIKDFLIASFDHIPQLVPETQPLGTQPPSLNHQLDVLLRRRIKLFLDQMKSCSVSAKQIKARQLNAKRLSILLEFRKEVDANAILRDTSEKFVNFEKYVNSLL